MSIPKEPRQLMINVMYLVLTALLALNVSAEIFNAFDMVDKGLKNANNSLDAENAKMPDLIKTGAKKKAELQKYADRVDPARAISQEATTYLQEIITKVVDEGGNRNGKVDDDDYITLNTGAKELKGKRNFDATTRLLVDDGKGMELKKKIIEIRDKYLALIDDADKATFSLPLAIDDKSWTLSANKKKNWADFTFGHMPIGATMPIFSKYINDVKASEAAVLNYLANKVGTTTDLVIDQFRVVAAPKKSYIIKGEQYEADVFVSASASKSSNTGISIAVNGRSLSMDETGTAKYTETPNSVGKRTYKATAVVTNPTTGEKKPYNAEFEYEVGERSVAISASKMNVFYIGVDNPVEISAAGVNSNDIKVSMSGGGGGTISKNPDGTFTVKVTSVTPKGTFAKIVVTAQGMNASKDFRVKRIPNPTPMLGQKQGGSMGDGEFKAYPGVFPVLENFDFDAKCEITEFLLIRTARRQDPEFSPNSGGRYSGKSGTLIAKAAPGDTYIYQDIKGRCPGDQAARPLGTMVVTIK